MLGWATSTWGERRRRLSLALAAILLTSVAWVSVPVQAATDPGTIWTWGANGFGQLGDGTTSANLVPTQVPGLSGIIDVHGGREHVVALSQDGTVHTWGSNQHGQIGRGASGGSQTTPFQVPGISDVVAVTTGHYHSLALRSDGSVWGWGYNGLGQLGDGSNSNRAAPVRVLGSHIFVKIAAGRDMSYAIRSDGTLWAWGLNTDGQLGDGTTTNRTSPVRVGTLTNVVDVAGGRDHGLAVLSDGSLWAWGWNQYGQLGDGTTTDRTLPVQIGTGYTQVVAGAHHSYALRTDGTVWSWGRNYRSALGDGTTTTRTRPVQVQGVTGAIEIGSGRDHGLAVLADGTVRAWGHNAYGQIGDGTTTARPQSVAVPGLTTVAMVVAGAEYSLALVADGSPPPPNQAPIAAIGSAECVYLHCSFSGAGSTDPDGTIVSYEWSLGEGATASGIDAQHTYSSAGSYQVVLTVTDDDGLSHAATAQVAVTAPPASGMVTFRAAAAVNVNQAAPRVTVPGSVMAGDVLVMIATLNSHSRTVSSPLGWTPLDSLSSSSATVQTHAWTKKATAADASSLVGPSFSGITKVALQVVAYSGAESVTNFSVDIDTVSTTVRTTPVVPIGAPGSMLISYWADKSSDGNGWILPSTVQLRSESVGSPNGLISAALADSGPLSTGSAGGIQATSTASANGRGVVWSIVVAPAQGGPSPNQPPEAIIALPSCSGLDCSFSGSGSSDPDGSIVGYEWDFGDGSTASGATTSHTFTAEGTHTVRLTVTDDDGATGATTREVTVVLTASGPGPIILISVDGLASSTLATLPASELPGWSRMVAEGATTLNARTTYEETRTLPNHLSMVTGRGVALPGGHGVDFNTDNGATVHVAAGEYVASVFDVVHDAGLPTSLFAWKTKFNFFDRSWDGINGAPDLTGPDSGKDKIDTFQIGDPWAAARNQLLSNPAKFTVLFFVGPDNAGHSFGWESEEYSEAVRNTDRVIAQVLNTVATTPTLSNAVVILTADHAGTGTNHAGSTLPVNYTIPFGVWGAGVSAGVDLYSINPNRLDPGTTRPTYSANPQPIRNGDVANLVTTLLGLPVVPGSTINPLGDLVVDGVPQDMPPTVTITSPTTGASVSGLVSITASASDDGEVESVQFTVDGAAIGTDTDASDGWMIEWDTATVSTGEHSLRAVALDDAGQTTPATPVTVMVAPAGNESPVAVVGVPVCDGLVCGFDGSGSFDPDGSVVLFEWDFGDGSGGNGVTTSHSFADSGTYTVELVVTDDQGATGSVPLEVTVVGDDPPPPVGSVSYRAGVTSNTNVPVPSVVVPSEVQAGDVLALFVTTNRDASMTVPEGWTSLGTRLDGSDLRTWALTRVASAGMAGSTVQVTLDARTKTDMTLLAYSGAAGVTAAVSANETASSAVHSSPSAQVEESGSWVVSYWADKSNPNTGWTLPGQVSGRTASATSGSGRIVAVSGDSGPVPAGTWAGLTATSGVSTGKAVAWTIVIAPS